MEQSKENFNENLVFGQEGEKEIGEILIKKGFNVMPLYQFSDELAPQIISKEKNYISPDLMCFRNGKSVFIEVKSKNKWVNYKGVIETGCNYKHYKHYKELAIKTKLEVYMVFNHVKGDFQGVYFVNVLTNGRYWDGIVNGEKIYNAEYFWNKNKLIQYKHE
tara:strand:- start:1232 stop:1717 length:486 start_codon:yes stop_codon:yes gene_type:complete